MTPDGRDAPCITSNMNMMIHNALNEQRMSSQREVCKSKMYTRGANRGANSPPSR